MAKNKISQKGCNGIRNAVIYARFSSHRQKEESIEQQVTECREYATENHFEITEVYADRAISGKTDRRASFQRMMRDAERGKFNTVIAYKSNRIGRNMLQTLSNESKLDAFGVRVLYAKEEFGNNAAGRFALRSMMNVNQFYSENMAEDIRRGLIDNANKCKVNHGSMPLGYKQGDDGKYAINEEAVPVVKEIFEKVYRGVPYIDIANSLNGRGIKTSQGKPWGRNSFHALLRNETYIGVYHYAEIRIEGGVPPIIEKELFFKVQDKLSAKKEMTGRRRDNGEYLLTGKLFCGHCKSPMIGISGTGRHGVLHFYYVCKKKREDKSCKKKNVQRDYIERIVAEAVKEYVLTADMMEWIAGEYVRLQARLIAESPVAIEKKQLADIQKSIKNVMTAIEQGIITETTKSRLVELENEKKHIETRILVDGSGLPTFTKEQVLFWLESFKNGDVDDMKYRRAIIKSFVDSVYLYDNELRIVFFYNGCGKSASKMLKKENSGDSVEDPSAVRISSPRLHHTKNAPFRRVFVCSKMLMVKPFFPFFITSRFLAISQN